MPTAATEKKARPKKCLTPEKDKLTMAEAIRRALLRSFVSGKGMVYYRCGCGWYHISSKTKSWSSR